MTQTELTDHIQRVKYPAARAVVKLLKDAGLCALHIGNLALDPWRPPGIYYFDDLDLLIRDADLPVHYGVGRISPDPR